MASVIRILLTWLQEIRNDDHSLFERGRGNSCSVEVNDFIRSAS